MIKFILASASPRRAEILKSLGQSFEILPSDVEEKITKNNPQEIVKELALLKAKDVARRVSKGQIVIAADTVVFKDDKILGKPSSKEEAFNMLKLLSGSIHKVLTGICVIDTANNKVCQDYEETKVFFKTLSDKEIMDYINTGEPMDKAGAYGIQGMGGLFVTRIEGCYFNVVGLPVHKLYNLMGEMGVNLLVKDV
jgi:septum formation protein